MSKSRQSCTAFPGGRSNPWPTPPSEYHAALRAARSLMQSNANPPSICLSHSIRRQTKRTVAAWALAGLDDKRLLRHYALRYWQAFGHLLA
jgi:hypothetical protein